MQKPIVSIVALLLCLAIVSAADEKIYLPIAAFPSQENTPLPIVQITPIAIQQAICNPGEVRCERREYQVCKGNNWVTIETCSKSQHCNEKAGCISLPETARIPGIGTLPIGRERPNIHPLPHEITLPNLFRTRLDCPTPRPSKLTLPLPPYNEKQGDCALVGRSADIENYLQELEHIAQDCRARAASTWATVQNARTNLLSQINEFSPPRPEDTAPSITVPTLPILCLAPFHSSEPYPPSEPIPPEGFRYTHWLKLIGQRVIRYCKDIDDLMKPLIRTCQDINEQAHCMITDREGISNSEKHTFGLQLNASVNGAQIVYDNLPFLYNSSLEFYGWGNFRTSFNESDLHCITRPRIPDLTIPPYMPPGYMTGQTVRQTPTWLLNWFFGSH